ncbi:O-methyltransferase [Shewanella frigidimarina]|uniref:O-methyltransferase n=1 Tax=Shewanella frigidimarina TaxID=56812 RepID=UPI003D793693
MSNSGQKINYSLRPSKNIERKMMRDMFQKVGYFSRLSDYSYIGFGAKYFEDFSLFHKTLHIDTLISIEGDNNNRQRYDFNKPFKCIDIKFGMSTDVLPTLNYDGKVIVWLDYDSRFNNKMLSDLNILVEKVKSGSIISLSYNSETYNDQDLGLLDGHQLTYKDKFTELVGGDNIPSSFDERGWHNHGNFCKFIRSAIITTLQQSIKERNDGSEVNDSIDFKQIMYFRYADGQKMTTLSFVIYKSLEKDKINACRFEDLYFHRNSDVAYDIKVPNFTLKEIRHLNENMPLDNDTSLNKKVFSAKDVEIFKDNYKYFPSYTEIESF